jgi:hypothetical protein
LEFFLILLVICASAPAWYSLIKEGPLPRSYRISVSFLTLSLLLQLVFITCVGARLITLDYSLRFAAVGIPCAVIAIGFAFIKEQEFATPRGASIGSSLGLVIWLLLITMH